MGVDRLGLCAKAGPAGADQAALIGPAVRDERVAGTAAQRFVVPSAAALLLWPAVWNGYPIVFADTGTYLSQAIHHYAGWDRPMFYSLFMLPLHATVTVWPVVVVQALIAAYVLRLVCRVLVPTLSAGAFIGGVAVLSLVTWLPWLASELMPDLFTPLLVLLLGVLAWSPERISRGEQLSLVPLVTFMIASQQSSLPLSCLLVGALALLGWWRVTRQRTPGDALAHEPRPALPRRALLILLPNALAVISLCTVNLAAHGDFAVSPFGNVFLLARVIYDGPGMAVMRRDCPTQAWRLCPFLDRFPATSDDFLWNRDSPLNLAGGPKIVSRDANAIIGAAWRSEPAAASRAVIKNILEQLRHFESGDGLEPWPLQVTPWITRDFPSRERAAYAAAAQQNGLMSMPAALAATHEAVALSGVIACVLLLPVAARRKATCLGFLVAVLLALPLGAAITGGLSSPHDRYQSRIMWLPPFIAALSFLSLRAAPAPPPSRVARSLSAGPPQATPMLHRGGPA